LGFEIPGPFIYKGLIIFSFFSALIGRLAIVSPNVFLGWSSCSCMSSPIRFLPSSFFAASSSLISSGAVSGVSCTYISLLPAKSTRVLS